MERITNLRSFIKDPASFLDGHFDRDRTSSMQKVPIGHRNFYLVFDPDLAGEILTRRNEEFVQYRMVFDRIRPVTGARGLVQLNGEASRRARQTVRSMFSRENMSLMRQELVRIVEERLSRLESGTSVDVPSFMSELILVTAFRLFLGIDLKEGALEMAHDFLELNRLCGERMRGFSVLPEFRIHKLKGRLRRRIIRELESQSTSALTVASLFRQDPDLIDHCMTFLFAGHETTASSLAFTLLLLGSRPDFQERIASGESRFAELVYKEALRLFPPAYMLVRQASQQTELRGEKIRKGSPVIIGLRQMHRREDCFENPEAFIPERFLTASRGFMPFGLGPKSCIGEGLAYLESEVFLEAFCRRFKFTGPRELRSLSHITLHPEEGQKICVFKRE